MNILLTGADGFIGSHVRHVLTAAGHSVRPLSRRNGYDFSTLIHPACWMDVLEGIQAVVNTVGIIHEDNKQRFDQIHTISPLALFQACQVMGVKRVVHISALGADSKANTAFLRSKGLSDDFLKTQSLEWLILRPSLVYGEGGVSADLFNRLARFRLIPLPEGGSQTIQPVNIDDVVFAVLKALSTSATHQIVPLVGPTIFTLTEWLQALRQNQGLGPAHVLRLPMPLSRFIFRFGRNIHPLLQTDTLKMLQAGCTADSGSFTRLLGRPPKSALHKDITPQGENS